MPSCPGGTGKDHGNTGSALLSFYPKRQRFRFSLRPLGGVFLYVCPKESWEPAMGSTANVLSLPPAESPGYSLPISEQLRLRHNAELSLVGRNSRRPSNLSQLILL